MTLPPLIIAVPKGRILDELKPLLSRAGIEPEADFFADDSRRLQFSCADSAISLIRVRSFDVPTFVAFGGAQIGIAGSDVLAELNYEDIYQPLDLGIGRCRMSVASFPQQKAKNFRLSHVRVATKYPNLATRHFSARGIQAECVKLNGAMELAPRLGIAEYIVDLVSSGKTLAANGLIETEIIANISSQLIVNRSAFKTRNTEINALINSFREAINAPA